jgi:hypothetical protein
MTSGVNQLEILVKPALTAPFLNSMGAADLVCFLLVPG